MAAWCSAGVAWSSSRTSRCRETRARSVTPCQLPGRPSRSGGGGRKAGGRGAQNVRGELDARGAGRVGRGPAGDLGGEAEAGGDLAEHDQLVRGDLPAGDARHDGVAAVALDVGEELVVGVL